MAAHTARAYAREHGLASASASAAALFPPAATASACDIPPPPAATDSSSSSSSGSSSNSGGRAAGYQSFAPLDGEGGEGKRGAPPDGDHDGGGAAAASPQGASSYEPLSALMPGGRLHHSDSVMVPAVAAWYDWFR